MLENHALYISGGVGLDSFEFQKYNILTSHHLAMSK